MSRTTRLTALSTLAAVLAVTSGFLLTGSAAGAVIPGAIKTISTTSTSVAQWDTVGFTCTWAVPNGAAPNDTFTLQLPKELAWRGSADFNLTNAAGAVVATAHSDSHGLVTFTLTSFVKTHSDVHGGCAFSTQFTAPTDGTKQTLSFNVGSSLTRVPVRTTAPCTTDCPTPSRPSAFKWSYWTDNSQTEIQSVIGSPPVPTDKADVVIKDLPDAGIALDCSSVRVVIGTHLNAGGALIDPADTTGYTWTKACSETALTVTVRGLPRGEMVDVIVDSTIVDQSLTTYTNKGTVNIGGSDVPVDSHAVRTTASGSGDGAVPAPVPSQSPPSVPSPTTGTPTTPSAPVTFTAGTPTAHVHVSGLPDTGNPVPVWALVIGLLLVTTGAVMVVRAARTSAS
jgi:uncharacterized surface anchored protein